VFGTWAGCASALYYLRVAGGEVLQEELRASRLRLTVSQRGALALAARYAVGAVLVAATKIGTKPVLTR